MTSKFQKDIFSVGNSLFLNSSESEPFCEESKVKGRRTKAKEKLTDAPLHTSHTSDAKAFPTKSKEILEWLDQYVSGQDDAKKSLIVIDSCRDRRNKVKDEDLKNSMKPFNTVFYGPTGCGKSYLIEKLAMHKGRPFIKTNATEYTEVGYVGRNVEEMIKDLIEESVRLVRQRHLDAVKEKVRAEVCRQIIFTKFNISKEENSRAYDVHCEKLLKGDFNEEEIEIEVSDDAKNFESIDIPGSGGGAQILNFGELIGKLFGKRVLKKVTVTILEAAKLLAEEESAKLLSESEIVKEAIMLAQDEGVIFIDEIDKIVAGANTSIKGDVSKEGVQRDLLPLLDGTTLNTKYGPIKTHHILFVAAGAFHISKFSDLLPELQGRFPVQVKLHPLTEKHYFDILNNKKHSLLQQHQAMLATEGVELVFEQDAIAEIAKVTAELNQSIEETGARRLRTIVYTVLYDINFDSESFKGRFVIDAKYVQEKVKSMLFEMDLKKFVL